MQHSVFEKRGLDAFVVVLMACELEATRCCVNIGNCSQVKSGLMVQREMESLVHLYHFENRRRCILLHADLMFMLIFAQPSKSMAAAPSLAILIRSKLFEHAVRMLNEISKEYCALLYCDSRNFLATGDERRG